MNPRDLFTDLRIELRFPLREARKTDYIRGGLLLLATLCVIGIPTFIGYLAFLVKAQLNDADFIPPLDPELIGDYTYTGVRYLAFTLGSVALSISIMWGVLALELSTLLTGVLLLIVVCNFLYFLPISFVYYAKRNRPIPITKDEVEGFYRTALSYEYMSAILILIFGTLILGTLTIIVSMFVITIPVALIWIWILSVSFTRVLGYAVKASGKI